MAQEYPTPQQPQPSSEEGAVYVIDSYGLIYRAYFAFISRPLTYKGSNISALFGFFRNLAALIKARRPQKIVAAFDSRTPTFRHQMYPEYKATREKAPEDLHAQIPWIEEALCALGVPALRQDGVEADDIIATVARKCEESGLPCKILSGDKDLMQLVNENVHVLKPSKDGGWDELGAAQVEQDWGVSPSQLLDFLSLTGDSADNVPGVAGVGEKTAAKFLKQYGSLDAIFADVENIKGAAGGKLRAGKDSAYFSRKLIALKDDVELEFNPAQSAAQELDFEAAALVLQKYGAEAVARTFRALSGKKASSSDASSDSSEEKKMELRQNCGSYRAVCELAQLRKYIEEIANSAEKTFAFDTETDSLNSLRCRMLGFSISAEAGTGIYVPIARGDDLFNAGIAREDALAALEPLFGNPDALAVMHNAKFDLEVLGLPRLKCRLADTMIAAWLLKSEGQGKNSFSLEYLAEHHLGLKGTEFSELVPKGSTFADVPLEKAAAYSAEDSDFTLQLWKAFEPELRSQKLDNLFWNLEMKVLPILARMEASGIHLDSSALRAYESELNSKIDSAKKEIIDLAGYEFNIASPKQLQEVLFEHLRLPHGKKTKTGYSTDTAVLEELQYLHPVPKKILEFRGMAKLLSTYVETLPVLADGRGRVHTSYVQTGTATGRLSSRDPNMQNIPVRDEAGRRIRSAFTAEPGSVLISADYSQIELVVLAHLSGDPALQKSFIEGTDVHKATAALLFGVQPEAVTAEMRRTAKTINFGVIYGMSAFRLSNQLGIPRAKAKEFIDNYFDTYSRLRSWIEGVCQQARADGYVSTLMGRRREIYGINSKNKLEQSAAERMAVNTPVQGSAADIMKQAMINVASALEREGSPARMLLQVHDELILECPDDEAQVQKAIALVRTNMEGAASLSVPLRVSIEHGRNWGEFH